MVPESMYFNIFVISNGKKKKRKKLFPIFKKMCGGGWVEGGGVVGNMSLST